DIVMFDNFSPEHIAALSQRFSKGKTLFEASGGIGPEEAVKYAASGVDLISMGCLTHSVKALKIHMVFRKVRSAGRKDKRPHRVEGH
ncbi:MAG: hypothetical protein PHQ23_11730, partial [Candidatus Wallbacteria bacterium]|nr:hypothetical protein [Candidatus Wallbacteria bacterium]